MRTPSTLHLPSSVARRFRLEQLIAIQLGCSGSEGWRLREMFALSGPELAFARRLVDRHPDLWLYRTNQRHFCGDFVAVDMSAAQDRAACAIELKAGEPLRTGVGGVQFAGLDAALVELSGVIGDGAVTTAQGDPDALHLHLATRGFRGVGG